MFDNPLASSQTLALTGDSAVDNVSMLAISAAPTTLYLTESNKLDVTIYTGGATIPDTNASLLLMFDSKLPATTWAKVSVSAPGFDTICEQHGHVTQWRLVPLAALPIQLALQVVVTFDGLTPPGGSPAISKIILTWSGLKGLSDGSRSQRLLITAPPTESAVLQLTYAWIAPDQPGQSRDVSEVQPVWVSTDEANAISNRIAFMISNTGNTPVVASGNAGHPAFYLSFDTVVNAYDPGNFDALCTLEEVQQMTAKHETDGYTNWSLSPKANEDGRWPLVPGDDAVLGARQSLTVTFDGLETYLPTFITALYIDWENVPGYCNGTATLPIQKRHAPPTIVDFHADPNDNLAAGQEVTLKWNTYGNRRPDPVRICLRDNPSETVKDNLPAVGSFKVYPTEPTHYRLQLVDVVPTVEGDCSVNVLPVAVSLTVAPPGPYYDGSAVTLTATLQYAQSYSLNLHFDVEGGFNAGFPIIPSTPLGGSTTVTQAISLTPPQLDDPEVSPPSFGTDFQLTCLLTATGYQGPQSQTLTLDVKALPFFKNNGSYQVGLDIKPTSTFYPMPSGVGMIFLEPVTADGLLNGFNVQLSDLDRTTAQGAPVAIVFDCTFDSEGDSIFTVNQTSPILNNTLHNSFNPYSYVLQRLALATPLIVKKGQVIGFVNSGPNKMYLNWVDGPDHHVWMQWITPQIGFSVGRGRGDVGTSCVACGWNFTGYL